MTSADGDGMIGNLAREIVGTYQQVGGINRLSEKNLPSQAAVVAILEELMAIVFPGYHGAPLAGQTGLTELVGGRLREVNGHLCMVIERTLRFCHQLGGAEFDRWPGLDPETGADRFDVLAMELTEAFLVQLPEIRRSLALDVQAAFEGDPAAKNIEEVILCYPGIMAVSVYRLAHALHQLGVPLIPRMMSEWAHHRSGVDIHPGATIGERFFIDHCTGVVIGETTAIGNDVKVYQGVTLGALSFCRNPDGTLVKGGKRHPTIGDNVTIYANATILGGETEIGDGAVVGGGAWIVASVAPFSVVRQTGSRDLPK